MTKELRVYQELLKAETLRALGDVSSVIMQLAMGGGKTLIAAHIVKEWWLAGRRVWFLVHLRELVKQTAEVFEEQGIPYGIIGNRFDTGPEEPIQICSIPSLRRRRKLPPPPDLVIWDECQHIKAVTWADLKDGYLSLSQHIGLTATPTRLDGASLRPWFPRMVCGASCGASPSYLIRAGHLSQFVYFAPPPPPGLGRVKKLAGEYQITELERLMNTPTIVGDAVEHYQRHVPGKRALVFACSTKASRDAAIRFREAGIPAAHVDHETPMVERDAALKALADGTIKVLCNVLLFTEGLDIPAIDAVILLRPTKSLALFLQMVGRGLRVSEGKEALIILDHAGNVFEHMCLPSTDIQWNLDGGRPKAASEDADSEDEELPSRPRVCPECNHVHEWAAECPICGHIYTAADRTVEEIRGELQEVFEIPPGYVTVAQFAKKHGITEQLVRKLIKRGLPSRKVA